MSKNKELKRQRRELEEQRRQFQLEQAQASQGRAFAMQFKGEVFAGPLPHPSILAQYEQIQPGAADRIIRMAENQQTHRHGLEKTVVDGGIAASKRGQNYAFMLGGLGIVVGGTLLALGRDIQGFTLLVVALGSLVGVFVYGRRQQKKERQQKLEPLKPPRQLPPSN